MITTGLILGTFAFLVLGAVMAVDGPSGFCHVCGGYPGQCKCLLAQEKEDIQ